MDVYDVDRYQRQITLLGHEGQERLRRARVLVAGVGGLGTIIVAYLAAAGVGFLRLVDNDRVEISNLNRQLLFQADDIGREKVVAAMEKLHILNPEIQVEGINKTINDETAEEMVKDVDLIVDALDNFVTRFVLNKVTFSHRLPLVHGAVRGLFGQATTLIPGKTGCLKCLLAQSPPKEIFPILGPTCGVIGAVQATETIKILTGRGEPLANRLFLWDGQAGEGTIIVTKRNSHCVICGGD
ncbi:MAG: HesA/MoeB/ThiF family protein [Smithella sp.]|jgi:adenylyltransferase/sulfurtransferase